MSGSDLFFSPTSLAAPLPPTPVDSNAYKRQRISSPAPLSSEKPSTDKPSIELAKQLRSENPDDVIEALHFLLYKSADHDVNYGLGRDGEQVVDALVELFDETIGWTHGNSQWEADENANDDESDIKPSSKTWESNVSPSHGASRSLDGLDWQTYCATKFAASTMNTAMSPSHILPRNLQNDENDKEGMKVLEIIIMIVRNLSYGTYIHFTKDT